MNFQGIDDCHTQLISLFLSDLKMDTFNIITKDIRNKFQDKFGFDISNFKNNKSDDPIKKFSQIFSFWIKEYHIIKDIHDKKNTYEEIQNKSFFDIKKDLELYVKKMEYIMMYLYMTSSLIQNNMDEKIKEEIIKETKLLLTNKEKNDEYIKKLLEAI